MLFPRSPDRVDGEEVTSMNEKIAQQQKHVQGIKTSFIWDELDRKFGILDNKNMEVMV